MGNCSVGAGAPEPSAAPRSGVRPVVDSFGPCGPLMSSPRVRSAAICAALIRLADAGTRSSIPRSNPTPGARRLPHYAVQGATRNIAPRRPCLLPDPRGPPHCVRCALAWVTASMSPTVLSINWCARSARARAVANSSPIDGTFRRPIPPRQADAHDGGLDRVQAGRRAGLRIVLVDADVHRPVLPVHRRSPLAVPVPRPCTREAPYEPVNDGHPGNTRAATFRPRRSRRRRGESTRWPARLCFRDGRIGCFRVNLVEQIDHLTAPTHEVPGRQFLATRTGGDENVDEWLVVGPLVDRGDESESGSRVTGSCAGSRRPAANPTRALSRPAPAAAARSGPRSGASAS